MQAVPTLTADTSSSCFFHLAFSIQLYFFVTASKQVHQVTSPKLCSDIIRLVQIDDILTSFLLVVRVLGHALYREPVYRQLSKGHTGT